MSLANDLLSHNDDNIIPPPFDFDVLVNDILENPEKILQNDLTSEQIFEIQKRLNPYAGIAGFSVKNEKKRIAAVSYTNLREDYLRRFTLTSFVGFIFQVFQEWEVPVAERQWVPAKNVSKPDDPNYQPFEINELVKKLEMSLAIAKEAQLADEDAKAAKAVVCEFEVCLSSEASDKEKNEVAKKYEIVEESSAKATGLLYAATHAAYRLGLESGIRLRATANECMKYQVVKELISKFPVPNPPGQLEMPANAAKEIIGSFLRNWLEFDPNVHVRSGYDAKAVENALKTTALRTVVDSKDPNRLTLEALRASAPNPSAEHRDAFTKITATKQSYNAVVSLLRDEDLLDAVLHAASARDEFCQYLFPVSKDSPARPAADVIPPQDTFHRWSYYTEVNYEEIRTITESIYPDRLDLDWAIALWDVFEGTTEEVDAAFNKHCQRFQDEIPSSIKSLEFGSWSLLADFKENRKKIQFYNKNTEVLKRILDRHSEDKRIGADLMKNRVRQVKARNIREDGPDALGLKQYKDSCSALGNDLNKKGAKKVISQEEMKRLDKANGSLKAAKELELLEHHEKTIADLSEIEKLRTLDSNEARDLTYAKTNIEKVREMIEVPDDTVQVNVFTNDTSTGEFGKTHFYTKADEPVSHKDTTDESCHPATYIDKKKADNVRTLSEM